MNKRFLLIIIGTAVGIDKDLDNIANSENGVSYVDGKGMFICTFYSSLPMSEIHRKLAHRQAMMVFDITDSENYGINLPTKYYLGIFPEIKNMMGDMAKQQNEMTDNRQSTITKRKNEVKEEVVVEEYEVVDDILDKLSRNGYDRNCLTEKEKNILNKA